MNNYHTQQKGFAMLLALIISSIALAIGLSILSVTLKQLSLGSTAKGSEIAFQVANAGMECLRYTRNVESLDFIGGNSNISPLCFGASSSFTFTESATSVYKYTYPTLNWNTSDGNRCIDMELFIIDASQSSGSGITYTFPNSGDRTCAAGDICTYGFVRGYNRDCNEIASSIFTVQREITAEF